MEDMVRSRKGGARRENYQTNPIGFAQALRYALRASKQHDAISARPLRLGFVQAGVEMLFWESQKRTQLRISGEVGGAKKGNCDLGTTWPLLENSIFANEPISMQAGVEISKKRSQNEPKFGGRKGQIGGGRGGLADFAHGCLRLMRAEGVIRNPHPNPLP